MATRGDHEVEAAEADPDDGRRTTVNLDRRDRVPPSARSGAFRGRALHRASKAQDCLEAGRRNCAAAVAR